MGGLIMLLGVSLVFFSTVFISAIPSTESSITDDSGTKTTGSVDENKKQLSEDGSSIFYQTASNQFYISKIATNFTEAEKTCKNVGMELTSMTSQKKQSELFRILYVNDLVPKDQFSGYWLSGNDVGKQVFSWKTSDEKIECWGWLPYEPNYPIREHCVELKFDEAFVRLGWNNLSCEKNRRFICQPLPANNKDDLLGQQNKLEQEANESKNYSCVWRFCHSHTNC